MPAPEFAFPLRMVRFESVTTTVATEMFTTPPVLWPSMMVPWLEPIRLKFIAIVRCSWYRPAVTKMESPEPASEIACPIVLQAVEADRQLLLSFPFAPSTYHVVLARTIGANARSRSANGRTRVCFIDVLLLSYN